MSDRPKPGKDKDLRCIRQAIDETDKLYSLLSTGTNSHQLFNNGGLIAEAMLLTIDQLDFLDQMLDDVALLPTLAIEHNRCLRNILKRVMHQNTPLVDSINFTRMIQAVGDQLKALLIVKDIRMNGG